MAINAALTRLGYGIAAITCLSQSMPCVAAFSIAELELSAQDLNTTDYDEVDDFVRRWATLSRGSLRKPQHPPLASQLPVYGIARRQDDVACSWNGGGACFGDAKCCGTLFNGWCCHNTEGCCQGSPSGCCAESAFCCGSMTGQEDGNCCARGETCCTPSDRKPYCCDEDQTCNNRDGECVNPTVTITRTRTEWSTRTQAETITETSTTTDETTRVVWSTRHTTISNIETGTVTETETVTSTLQPSGGRARRKAPDIPTSTSSMRLPEGTPRQQTPSPEMEFSDQVVVIRPAPSLDALADALARRGLAVERRATITATEWRTVHSTTIEGTRTTIVEWRTEWETTTETDFTTETTFMNAKETETETTTTTTWVTAAASSKEDNTKSSTESSADSTKSFSDSLASSTDSSDSATAKGGAASTSSRQDSSSQSTSTPGLDADSDSNGPPLGAIIGGAVGGAVGLILIALIAGWFLWRRRMNQLMQEQGAAGGVATGIDGGPPYMLPSEHSVSPLAQGGYAAPGKGAVAGVHEHSSGSWGSTPHPMQEMSNTPIIPPAQLATSPQSGHSTPQAGTMPSQFPGNNGGYESFDFYSQGYFMPHGSQPSGVPQEIYSPGGNMNTPPEAGERR